MIKKSISLCAAVVAGAILFSGCSQQSEQHDSQETADYADLTGYSIVRPETADELEIEAATTLRKALEPIYPDIKLTTDYIKRNNTEPLPTNEILVGVTNREESSALLDELSSRDFAISFEGERVAIVGGSYDATVRAVEYFTENYIDDTNKLTLLKEGTHISRYEYPNPIINGRTLSEFSIHADARMYSEKLSSLVSYETNQTLAQSSDNKIMFSTDPKLELSKARVSVKDGNLLIEVSSSTHG